MPENNRKMQTDISELENGQLAEQQLPSDFTLVVLAGGASSHMGRGEVRSAFRWTDIFGDTDRKRMSVGEQNRS